MDYSPRLSQQLGLELFLKKEHLSITGSYKERGALNKLLTLSDSERAAGVVCSSAGNHAQAVSYHSTRLGIDSVIVMPETTPHVKVLATKRFGGRVVLHGTSFGEAFEHASEICERDGRTFVHAFNDKAVVAGQGTVAMEVLEQNPFLDAIIVPVGGGGLIAGMSLVLKRVNPRIKIIGVEAESMAGMRESVRADKVVSVPKTPTMADGIAIENVGKVPFDVIRELVDDIVTVDEDEIAASVLTLLEVEKTVVEGAGATCLAALQSGKLDLGGQSVGIVLTGGNIDMTLLGRIIEKGLVQTGRLCRFRVTVADVPGRLALLTKIVADLRANTKSVEHERAFLLDNVYFTQPVLTCETRDFEHIQEIYAALKAAGFAKVEMDTPRQPVALDPTKKVE